MVSRLDNSSLIVIVGETASGKSALAMKLAKQFNGEIICADSWTVYKGFDIGTAKPSKQDQQEIKHHLLDIASPEIGFSAAIFKQLASKAIKDINSRDKLPILVGGTGLYIDSVLYDYKFLPPPKPELRKQLNAMTLAELLRLVDSRNLDVSKIDIRNKRRVLRLIENNGQQPGKKPMLSNTLILGIKITAEELESKITQRVEAMVKMGLVEEVISLGKRYGWDIEAFRAPGYRAFKDYIEGAISINQAKERFIRNDLQLAKKQRTWFKRNKSIRWTNNQIEAVDLVTTFLNK